MKRLLILSLIGLAIVAGLSLFANTMIESAKELDAELTREFEGHLAALRALDRRYPDGAPGTAPEDRLEACMRARAKLASIYVAHARSGRKGALALRETRNAALTVLTRELETARMGPTEYRRLSAGFEELSTLSGFDEGLGEALARTD